MAKKKQKYNNPRLNDIFDDLEKYREFCQDYGYVFNEATLYDMRSYPFQQYNKMLQGKNFKDQWAVDLNRLG